MSENMDKNEINETTEETEVTGALIISALMRSSNDYTELLKTLRPSKPVQVTGVTDSATPLFIASLAEDISEQHPAVVICKDEKNCRSIVSALASIDRRAEIFPARDYNFNNITASREFEHERLRVLSALAGGEDFTVVTTPQALLQPTVTKDELLARELFLEVGIELPIDAAIGILEDGGYSRADVVEGPGQYAVRGGILDVHAPGFAVRAEFFGDEIDRLGILDPETQRITENIGESALIPPARELICGTAAIEALTASIKKQLKVAEGTAAESILRSELAALQTGDAPFIDKYIPHVVKEYATLFDYTDGCVILWETTKLEEFADAAVNLTMQSITAMVESGELTLPRKGTPHLLDWGDVLAAISKRVCISIESFGRGVRGAKNEEFGLSTRHITPFGGDVTRLTEELSVYVSKHMRVVILTANDEESRNLKETLLDDGYTVTTDPVVFLENCETDPPVLLTPMSCDGGFELAFARTAVLAYSAVSAVRKSARLKKSKVKDSARKQLMSYTDLTPGDFVVHTVYGIGQFLGIETIEAAGTVRDYISIAYAGTDKLFLPVDQLELLSKYIGAGSDDGTVKLSKMGGADWNRAKTRAKAAAKDMAKELIDLYARRRRTQGISFDYDDDFSSMFADSFMYEETEGQLAAIEDITRDMEEHFPMDRLLCGDVGYGKTEVALRAAFKAVRSGYQVAILVPTTILAFQHYQTVLSRMRGFPVKVDMVSRFRTPKEQAATLRKLRRGEVDIIIGTHRLISKDVEFAKLGLLIIDEEQRFGVAQKEKLKQAHPGVDVLTLTATPIPRTLNMAMGQILDMSILEEAPGMRSPVQTYVMEHDRAVIAEALRRELRRGGQAFYLHNKVETVYAVAKRLQEDLPDARIAVGHGKMDRDELEEIWELLVRGEIDILVSTTIIETGIDVPNANTLIIDDANRYGLSQLHQLRGRVGRSARRAYAYFTYSPTIALSEIASKRLAAIKEYAEFGAGFKIAMRDLEIRGAGNMLGAEQHGHLDAVGYDMYIRLLEEAVLEENGQVIEKKRECVADIEADAYLPKSYISAPHLRMEMYKKIARIETDEDYVDITDELIDRFGDIPENAENLCRIAVTRALAASCGITKLQAKNGEVVMIPELIDPEAWLTVEKEYPRGSMRVIPGKTPAVHLKLQKGEVPLDAAEGVVRCLSRIMTDLEIKRKSAADAD